MDTANVVTVGHISLGGGHPLVLIAGPCVIEDQKVMRESAQALVQMCRELEVPLIFKSSYEKDNRGDRAAYRGPGLESGLALLAALRREFGVPVTTDVHRPSDVPAVAAAVDLVQIPALLCRQTSLLEAAGRGGRAVNLKKGQFMSPAAMEGSVDKIRAAGERRVLVTERGTSFGYDQLVCDLTAVPALQALGCPVVLDAGHAANRREWISTLSRAGVAAGADALFLECHPDPQAALCDGARMLSLEEVERLLRAVAPLARAVRGKEGRGPA